jgi:RNA polymerase sigma-70 factor (ECF subfamily)
MPFKLALPAGIRARPSHPPDLSVDEEPPLEAEFLTALTAPITPHPEEMNWIARARCGDVVAFEWLATRYRDRAVRLAAHILRQPEEAEDLVQEAFLRAFVQIGGFRGDAAFYTWLYRILVRLCLNRMRRPYWHREREQLSARMADPTGQPGPEQYADRLMIETLLHRLTPPQRAVLVLREVEGLDYQEIADTLEIPVGTVRSRLNAARSQFRVLWQRAMKEVSDV